MNGATSITICRNRCHRYSPETRILVFASFFLFSIAFLASPSSAATAQGGTTLAVRVEQAAGMTIHPVASEARLGSGEGIRWFSVELWIRMNPGTTASLWVQPISGSAGTEADGIGGYFLEGRDLAPASLAAGDHSKPIFTLRQNGRFHLTIGVAYPGGSEIDAVSDQAVSDQKVQFQLRSSDAALSLSKII